jgi:hypothetical protein
MIVRPGSGPPLKRGTLVRSLAAIMAVTIGVGGSFLTMEPARAASDGSLLNLPAERDAAGSLADQPSSEEQASTQKRMQTTGSAIPIAPMKPSLQLADASTSNTGTSNASSAPGGDAYQEVPRDQTVRERARPEVDALGLHLSSFYAYPSVRTTETYDDNIFATPSHTDGDFITVVAPELSIQSDWNNHALNFDAGAAAGYYASHTGEDYVDYHFGTNGRLDVTRDDQLTSAFTYRHEHEDRSSPDDRQGEEPTEYDLFQTQIGDQNRFGRFTVKLDAQLNRYNFFDVSAFGGGTINNDDRDRLSTLGSATLSYEIVPDYEAYVRVSYNRQDYDSHFDNDGFERNSQGFETVAGLAIDLGGVTRADIFAGYQTQYYQDSAFDTVAGPSFGASLTWNVTGITTVTATLTRTLQETTTPGASGYFSTDAILNIDHELLRNLILNLYGGYSNRDYQGIGRNDNVWIAGTGAEYLMNRYMSMDAKYQFDDRDSSDAEEDYVRNLFLLSLNLKL